MCRRYIVGERLGADLAEAVANFFREVDTAVRIWPCPTNGLFFSLSLVERRGLFEPLMHSREDVTLGPDAPWWKGQVHIGPEAERTNLFWDGSITPPESHRTLGCLEWDFDLAISHLTRGLSDIRTAVGEAMTEELALEIDRIDIFRCLLRTLNHKSLVQKSWSLIAALTASDRAKETRHWPTRVEP